MLEVTKKEEQLHRQLLKPVRNQSSLIDLSKGFSSLSRPTRRDITLFQEQFYTLILNTSSVERKQISEIIARSEYTPKPLIIFMATQEIAIAQPPLLYSPVLQPADLNLILEKTSLEQAKVIARRNDLDETNIKALLKMDNVAEQIKTLLLSNEAVTTKKELLEVLETCHLASEESVEPAQITNVQSLDIPAAKINTRTKDLSDTLLKLANKGGRLQRKPSGKPVKSAQSAITLKQIENQLLSCLRSKNLKSFAVSIQHFCGLKSPITFQILRTQNAGMLATLLHALEITDVTAARILLMANLDVGRNAHIFKVVMEKYKNLDHAECISYFEKLGADFSHAHFKETKHIPTTRYALSLAARARRAALLKNQENSSEAKSEIRLSA